MSGQERSGWRDLALNDRHRLYGVNCPAVDVDLFIEYDHGIPRGLVEYKHECARPQSPSHPSMRALINLGDSASLPVLGVRYAADFSQWTVRPLNSVAFEHVACTTIMDEDTYVRLLYSIRDREMSRQEHDAYFKEIQLSLMASS